MDLLSWILDDDHETYGVTEDYNKDDDDDD